TVTTANNANYTIVFVGGKLTIDKRGVTVCAEDKEMTYGESKPTNSFVLCDDSSLVGSDALGSATYTYSTANPVNAGDYDITPSAAVLSTGSASNYEFTYKKGTLTIKKRQISVTAADKNRQYGQTDPVFTYTVTSGSTVNGDTFTGALSRESGEDVGDYAITLGSLSLGNNYEITVAGGTLTINKRQVKVIPSPNQKKTYGDNDPSFTFTTDITLPFSESLAGDLGRDAGEDVNNYAYTLGSVATSNPNYEITIDTANKFKIDKFAVTITVNNLEKIYGEEDPEYTYTFSPATLGNGDPITVTGSPTRATGENVGSYAISVGTLSAGSNYLATITPGSKLTIKKRPITVLAGDTTMVYGSALPANSVTVVSGTMVGSETVSGATYSYSTNPPRNVGDYTITPSAATVSGGLASNYDFSYETGTLTITKADLTIYLADSNSDWGDKIAPAGAKYSEGLKNNDKLGTFSYTFDGSSDQPTLPGSYALDGTVVSFS
ncbi:MAG: hypothetical protein EBR26_05895, partial [Microbacteriaceae bacterium]|nr:hypothetical protein [Microbacteriaceae bacterium]